MRSSWLGVQVNEFKSGLFADSMRSTSFSGNPIKYRRWRYRDTEDVSRSVASTAGPWSMSCQCSLALKNLLYLHRRYSIGFPGKPSECIICVCRGEEGQWSLSMKQEKCLTHDSCDFALSFWKVQSVRNMSLPNLTATESISLMYRSSSIVTHRRKSLK